MSSLTTSDLRRIFNEIDQNKDGFVSRDELNQLLKKLGFQFSLEELETHVERESLDLTEFLSFCNSILCQSKEGHEHDDGFQKEDFESDLVQAFGVFDLDGDGFITSHELESVLKKLGLWDDKCSKDSRSMIYAFDTNLDGRLDFEEFKSMMLLSMKTPFAF